VEAGVEFGGGYAALAVEPAEKLGGGTRSFEGIALEAGGDQITVGVGVGVASGFYTWDDVVEALDAGVGAHEAIEATAAFAEMKGLAQGAGF